MLRALLEPVDASAVRGPLDIEIGGIAYDSRRVRSGDAFFALAGARADGSAFARQAVEAGAVAVVGPRLEVHGVTTVQVPDARRSLAIAAARFHGDPSRDMRVVAVTGTNGKTTTTFLLEAIVAAAGHRAGVVGTTGVHVGDERRPAALTTPESLELQALLAEMRDREVWAVAMEMSSHALVQRRGYGVHCDAAVFTNLTHDHLDYHGTMEAYLDAKLMLFDGRNQAETIKPCTAVIHADDPAALRVEEAARRGRMAVKRFSGEPGEDRPDLDVHVVGLTPDASGLNLQVVTHEVKARSGSARLFALRLPLLGRYNASNAAGAWAAARALGVADELVVRGLETVTGVPGRLEAVRAGQPFLVVVDYAHTPDALARALAAVREHAAGHVLLVFGCGGDRDRAKRPLMGLAAAAGADQIWVTNDNPRGEDPRGIAREIEGGLKGTRYRVELDRRMAIAQALDAARAEDVVLIAGKGHEATQTIGEQVWPFDDREVAAEALGGGAAGGVR